MNKILGDNYNIIFSFKNPFNLAKKRTNYIYQVYKKLCKKTWVIWYHIYNLIQCCLDVPVPLSALPSSSPSLSLSTAFQTHFMSGQRKCILCLKLCFHGYSAIIKRTQTNLSVNFTFISNKQHLKHLSKIISQIHQSDQKSRMNVFLLRITATEQKWFQIFRLYAIFIHHLYFCLYSSCYLPQESSIFYPLIHLVDLKLSQIRKDMFSHILSTHVSLPFFYNSKTLKREL